MRQIHQRKYQKFSLPNDHAAFEYQATIDSKLLCLRILPGQHFNCAPTFLYRSSFVCGFCKVKIRDDTFGIAFGRLFSDFLVVLLEEFSNNNFPLQF